MITQSTYISADQVIGDAAAELGDTGFRKWGKPAYLSAAQRALATICHDVPWDTRHWEAEIPASLILPLPWGMTEKSLAVLFNGDHCDFRNVQTLHIKPNMYHKGGEGYVANNAGAGLDIAPGGLDWSGAWPQNYLYFAEDSAGCLYLSASCRAFQKVHITYSGLGIDCLGDDFRIPEWAREAITDAVILRGAKGLRAITRDNLYREIIREKEPQLALTNPNGTWLRALGHWGRMGQKDRMDTWTRTTWFGYPPY